MTAIQRQGPTVSSTRTSRFGHARLVRRLLRAQLDGHRLHHWNQQRPPPAIAGLPGEPRQFGVQFTLAMTNDRPRAWPEEQNVRR